MAIALTQNTDLQRVVIAITGFPNGLAHVERSVGPANTVANPGFETDTLGWFSSGGTLVRSTDEALSGVASGRTTPDGVTATVSAGITATAAPAVQVGVTYRSHVDVLFPAGYGSVNAAISWLDSGGLILSTTTGPVMAVPAGVWTRLEVFGDAPASSVSASPRVQVSGTPAGSDIFYSDDMYLARGALWQTVRGGVELPIIGGAGSLDDFEWQSDVQNFYRITPTSPGLVLDGTVGAYASTPDHASLDITGDLDLRADVTLTDWNVAGTHTFVGKYDHTVDQRSYRLSVITGGILRLNWSTDGINDLTEDSSIPVPVTSGRLVVRAVINVDNGAGGYNVAFYTAESIDGPFTQLGTVQTDTPVTSIHAGTAELSAGAIGAGTGGLMSDGDLIHGVRVLDGISGTVAADPDFTGHPMSTPSFTDSTGKLWTVNGTAFIAGTEENSLTPSLNGEVWFKSVRHTFLNMALPRVLRRDPSIGRRSRSQEFPVSGRSVGVAVSDVRLGQQFTLSVLAESLDDPLTFARNLDLAIASGDVFFIHVPGGTDPNRVVPGGYVILADTAQIPLTGGPDSPQEFTLPCTVVAQPPPEVVGGTMTWGALLNLYGGWNNLLAANPTWADLLQLIASPEDLVVI